MTDWRSWRKRAKSLKREGKWTDVKLATELEARVNEGLSEDDPAWRTIARGTVNSWFNNRDPNLSDFLLVCEILGADPGHVLFAVPVIRQQVPPGSATHRIVSAAPTALPEHKKLMGALESASKKVQTFKRKRRSLRTRVVLR